jgi:hypothetical protein
MPEGSCAGRLEVANQPITGCIRKEEVMSENKCQGDHRSHLCALAGNKRIREIKDLAASPEFICGNCGRVADSEKHVCSPEPLNK